MKNKLDNKKYVLSISYGDYSHGVGGTDRVIKAHQEMLNGEQISYLYIYPLRKINNRVKIPENNFWGCVKDGIHFGVFTTWDVKSIIYSLANDKYDLKAVFIHHLKNVDIGELCALLRGVTTPIYFYLHDYMTICPRGGLITSEDKYCGSSFPSKNKCRECMFYGKENAARIEEIKTLFHQISLNLQFIAPSIAASREWAKSYPEYANQIIVINHQQPKGAFIDNLNEISDKVPLRIGFVGYQKSLKGWDYWIEGVKKAVEKKCNIEFFQFGSTNDHYPFIEEICVDFKRSLTSMTDALREKNIHIAVLWSIWPETYSYTYYEAWAANTYILCNELSGNICDQVIKNGNGIVLSSPEKIIPLLADEERMRKLVNEFRHKGVCGPMYLPENRELIDLIPLNQQTTIQNLDNECSDASWLKKKVYSALFYINKKIKK